MIQLISNIALSQTSPGRIDDSDRLHSTHLEMCVYPVLSFCKLTPALDSIAQVASEIRGRKMELDDLIVSMLLIARVVELLCNEGYDQIPVMAACSPVSQRSHVREIVG